LAKEQRSASRRSYIGPEEGSCNGGAHPQLPAHPVRGSRGLSLKANIVLGLMAVFERAPQLMPHERSGGCGERNVSGSWWRFPPQGSLVEPTLGLLNQLAKREMSSKPLHHLGLPLNEESREKLNSRLRTNELWELA